MPLTAIKQIILIFNYFFVLILFFTCKKMSTIWEYMEENVYRKFEIKLKLTVNDMLFGYKGHSQPFTAIQFINHLLVSKICTGIFIYSTSLEI